jgi:hypothetical protein
MFVAAGDHLDLAGIAFRVTNELVNGVGGDLVIHHHYERSLTDARDRHDVLDEIETEIVIERRIDGIRRAGHQQRVTIGRRMSDQLGAEIAGGAGAVVDDNRLAQALGQPLRDKAGK